MQQPCAIPSSSSKNTQINSPPKTFIIFPEMELSSSNV